MGSLLARLGWLCAAHPWRVIAVWATLLAAALGLAIAIGGQGRYDPNAPNASPSIGYDFLRKSFPDMAGADTRVVVWTRSGRLNAADIATLRTQLQAVSGVSRVSPPRVSQAGDLALIAVQYRVPVTEFPGPQGLDALGRAIAATQRSGLQVELGGEVPENYVAGGPAVEKGSAIAAVCMILLAFGSLTAAVIPAAVGLFGVGIGFALILVMAGLIANTSTSSPTIAIFLGIGVGVDYALLYLARFREYLPQCPNAREAAGAANGSAGLSIVVAGTTVLVSLLGLRVAGIPPFSTFGYTTAVTIVAIMLATITVVPALCGMAGHRLVRRWAPDPSPANRGWTSRWAEHVSRRPAQWALATLMLLLVLAAPALGLRTWPRDAGSQPTSETARRAYDLIAAEFGPGANGPFTVGVDTGQVTTQQLLRTIDELRHDQDVANVSEPIYSPDGSAAVFTIEPASAPYEKATNTTLHEVRAQLPQGMYVTGLTPYFADFSDHLTHRLWLMIIVIVGLAAVLLSIVFKAPVVAIGGAVIKLLVAAATYGVLVVLFERGWGAAIFGLSRGVPISSWAAILLFVILFAVSTNSEVFLISRSREETLNTGDARQGVMRGFVATAPVVTIVAAIMIAICLAFAIDPDIVVTMMCVGLAIGLFLDGLVIRMVLIPAAMTLLGRFNWWTPQLMRHPVGRT